jgi:hypothetical protein
MPGRKSKSDCRGFETFSDDIKSVVLILIKRIVDSIMPVGVRILVLMPAGFFTFILQKHDV